MRKNQNSIGTDKLKGVLITRTAIKTLVPEDIVERVIMFQFKDARAQVQIHEQIEISGFGKLITSPAKIRRRLERMEGALGAMRKKTPEEIGERRMSYWQRSMEITEKAIDYLKTKKGGNEDKS